MTKGNLATQIAKLEEFKQAFISKPSYEIAKQAGEIIASIINNTTPQNYNQYQQIKQIIEWWYQQTSKQIANLHQQQQELTDNAKKMHNYTKAKNL